MQNIIRRQQSKSELPIGEKLELRELKGRLVMENGRPLSYGTTNVAFEEDDDSTSIDSNISVSITFIHNSIHYSLHSIRLYFLSIYSND